MVLRWLGVLACVSACIVAAYGAAVPTQDTLVVSRSDDKTTESEPATTEAVTEGPTPPIKLTEMTVDSQVSLRYAHTAVVARVKNPAKKAQEANFRVLLPETAFISGFVMTLDGKSYKAYVKEKEEAKQIYDQAVSQGVAAAHVQAKARDSNQFIVSVNVEPSSSAVFNLTYEELLVRRNGVYNHAINLHPGALVPKLAVTVHIKEAQKITDLRVPEIRTGNEIDATKDDAQNSKATITRGHDDREATITFTPDLEEQKALMQVYADKSKQSHTPPRWYENQDEEDQSKTEGVLGQFVVQYDVDRPKDGEILVNDGYFVHFFAPSSLPPLNKYVVFVLDTSGSMMDRKIVQLREAMDAILSDLNPGDFFSIVEFASSVTVHSLKEADQEPPPRYHYYYGEYDKAPTLVPPSPATEENLAKAKVITRRLNASGGTNIAAALDVAVNLIHKRTEWGKKKEPSPADANATEASTEVVLTTPEPVEIDPALTDIERMKTLEPIIIFLTDGDPTVGETNPNTIMTRLTEKNYGEDKASIFSLAFGEDADRKFLRKLSLRNDGFMRHIYEAADAALQLHDFYKQVSSPLLADVKFTYPENQVKSDTLTKNKFRTFYAGGEVVVAGRVADGAEEITPQVSGFCGVDAGFGKKRYEKLPKAPVPVQKQEYLPLERLWSYLTIKQLLDERDAADDTADDKKEDSPSKKALALALKYEFVTPLTSLVVVKPNATNAVDAESVDKPSYLPGGFGAPSPKVSANNGGVFLRSDRIPVSPRANVPFRLLFKRRKAAKPQSGGFAYASIASAPGLPGPPVPVFASQSLPEALFEQEEVDDYDNASLFGTDSPPMVNRLAAVRPLIIGGGYQKGALGSASSFGQALMSYDRISGVPAPASIGPMAFIPPPPPAASHDTSLTLVNDLVISSTPALPTLPTTSQPSKPRASEYHLEGFDWVEPLINATADVITIDSNGTNIDLKLTKELDVPKKAEGDAPCEAAVGGGAGVCVYLTRCSAAKTITTQVYSGTYCEVTDGYAGVCCRQADVIIKSD